MRDRTERRRSIALVAGVVVIITGALGWAALTDKKPRNPSAIDDKHQIEVDRLSSQLDKEPCDRQRVVELGELLLLHKDYRGALVRAEKFFATCGEHLQLRRLALTAHNRLSEFPQAITQVTKLIEANPNDKDYRWWRAEVYEAMGDLHRAAEDYREAIRIEPRISNIPFNLADVYERLGKPCEALAALNGYFQNHPGTQPEPRIQAQMEKLRSAGSCAPGMALAKKEATIVDPRTIRVTVKRDIDKMMKAFAEHDVETFLSYTHKHLIELAGGREIMIKAMNKVFAGMKEISATVGSVKVGEPSQVVDTGSELHCTVPVEMTMKIPLGKASIQSFYIGVSADSGATWTFLDGRKVTADNIKTFLPQYTPKLVLPWLSAQAQQ